MTAARRAAQAPRVLCLGSLNLDVVYRVPHVVRPGETIAAAAVEQHAGGKGANQSAALALAGARVSHAGRIGPDGEWVRAELERRGVDVRFVRVGDAPTGRALIQVDAGGENAIVLFRGANATLDEGDVDRALESFGPGDVLLAQNETTAVAYALRAARERGLRAVLNPAPMDEVVLRYPLELVDVLVVNRNEATGLVGDGAPEEILARLGGMLPAAEIVLTLGADGALCRAGDAVVAAPAVAAEAVDATGAGDTFLGFYLARRLAGDAIEAALRAAAQAAAIGVSRPGAMESIPSWRDVRRALRG